MYDLKFLFEECGFGNLPSYIERRRLFNVSFEPGTGDVKLYVLDRTERFVYKVSAEGITRQYAGDDVEHGGDPRVLVRHLGRRLDFDRIVIDAVEGDVYYLYIEDAGMDQRLRLVEALCATYDVTPECFLATANGINRRQFASVAESLAHHAVSLVKVPLSGRDVKLYSRPFHSGNGFDIDVKTRRFLLRAHGCGETELPALLKHAWVARELHSDRLLLVTQHHSLLHKD